MFDSLRALGSGELLAVMSVSLRAERSKVAHRLVAAGLFIERRIAAAKAETEYWAVDDWDVAAAEIGAELGTSRHRASADMNYGQSLVTRFPRVAARALAGQVDVRVIAAIDFRTGLVSDAEVLAKLDVVFARLAPHWNGLSRKKLIEVIDAQVIALDPESQRVPGEPAGDRCVEITPGTGGMAELWGRLGAVEGAALDQRLDGVAATVCAEDPRTHVQRRADALIALTEGVPLVCGCGSEDCPAAADVGSGGSQVVVHVIGEQATVNGTGDTPGYVAGYGPVPADTVRKAAATKTAKLTPLPIPAVDTVPEAGYRPSKGLAEFVGFRDMGCRFPGCTAAAVRCDVDHTVAWPHGSTHPSNTKLYCRHHHLLKTFWTGPDGWTDAQHPDGTVTFTSPSGRSFQTTPYGAWFFPQLASSTGVAPIRGEPPPHDRAKAAKMPRRRRTRAAAREARIESERAERRSLTEANPPPF